MDNLNYDFNPELLFASNLVIPVRSTKGIKRLSASERALITLPDEVKDILVGILLGNTLKHVVIALLVLSYLSFSIQENSAELTLMSITPVFVYSNLIEEKSLMYKENKGKSGIYRWTNKINGKTYIGSAKDLSIRLRKYFSTSHLLGVKYIMIIYRALIAHGYDNFKLEILEHCELNELIKKQYYLDLLKPEYNLAKIAGSSLGVKLSEETKEKIRAAYLNRSEEVIIKVTLKIT